MKKLLYAFFLFFLLYIAWHYGRYYGKLEERAIVKNLLDREIRVSLDTDFIIPDGEDFAGELAKGVCIPYQVNADQGFYPLMKYYRIILKGLPE